jgi:acetyl-CoA carboxylase biotin carboxyl carrier protein
VADDANHKPNPFDVGTIKNLVALMSRHDLSEIDLTVGDQRIRLRRGSRVVTAAPVAFPPATITPAPQPTPAAATTPNSAPAKEKPARNLIEIKSEIIGTFYAKPDPDAPEPFVTVGSRVTPDTVVCIIEAMKIMTNVQAGCTGVIAEILVQNGQPVEHGQVLFRVDPAG